MVPSVSEDPTFNGEQGMLPDVVGRHAGGYGGWREHDVMVCGSPAMTRATVSRLTALGVPADRMRYDVAGDEHPAAAQIIDLRRTRASRTTR